MNDSFDIPIFQKAYELYKTLYDYRNTVAKQDHYTLWQRLENICLDILAGILSASTLSKTKKRPALEKVSLKLNILRVFIRLSKEIKVIDNKKYIVLQEKIDEIGRMLGGWIKSTKT